MAPKLQQPVQAVVNQLLSNYWSTVLLLCLCSLHGFMELFRLLHCILAEGAAGKAEMEAEQQHHGGAGAHPEFLGI